jgi:hypothetical protein
LRLRVAPSIALPLVALLAAAVTALLIAAQAGLAFCNARVAIPVPAGGMPGMTGMADMPGMTMPAVPVGAHDLMICPVVLVLIAASVLLAALAIVMLWRDPHRALAGRTMVRTLATLPPLRAASVLAALGAAAVVAMLAVDRAGPPAPASCALLAALLAGCSVAAVALSMAAGRLVLALARRVVLALVAALTVPRPAPAARTARLVPCVCGILAASPLAAGRGLRAPPSIVR